MRAEPEETSNAKLYLTPPAAFTPQEHAVDACVAAPAFSGVFCGVPSQPDGVPVIRTGTNAALPGARLLAGLRRADGHNDAVDVQHDEFIGT